MRVRLAGICSTDLELLAGYYPYCGVPGHEFVGEVTRGPRELMGRRVVGEINAVCGVCAGLCVAQRRTHCERRTVLGIVNRQGAFAGVAAAAGREPVSSFRIDVPDEVAVFTEPLAAALEIQEQLSHSGPGRAGRGDRRRQAGADDRHVAGADRLRVDWSWAGTRRSSPC